MVLFFPAAVTNIYKHSLCVVWFVRVRAAALKGLVTLLQKEECHLQSLCIDDSKLKEQTVVILNALDENNSLRKLNIR